jgi:hypothetical protein
MVSLESINNKLRSLSKAKEEKKEDVAITEEPVPGLVEMDQTDSRKTVIVGTPNIGEVTSLSKETTTPDGVEIISEAPISMEKVTKVAESPVIIAEGEAAPIVQVATAGANVQVESIPTPVVVRRFDDVPQKPQDVVQDVQQAIVTTPEEDKILYHKELIAKGIIAVTVLAVGVDILLYIYDAGWIAGILLILFTFFIQVMLVGMYRKPGTTTT